MIPNKQQLRRQLILIRQNLTPQEVEIKSKTIIGKLLDNVDWQKVQRLHIYTPILGQNEVETKPIKDKLKKNWPHIRIVSPNPDKNQPIPTEEFDIIIVPILGYDKDKFRLGFGGGWYDRFLAGQPRARIIGLGYCISEVDAIPHEPHDIPMHQIITEVAILD